MPYLHSALAGRSPAFAGVNKKQEQARALALTLAPPLIRMAQSRRALTRAIALSQNGDALGRRGLLARPALASR